MNTTGSDIVNQMIDYNPQSLAIPHHWFTTIKYENGKPNMNAIIILAEIVYWYRPALEKDESTGEFSGYKKRFKADLLQKNRSGFVTAFGLTKRQVSSALEALEKLKVITSHLRKIELEGTVLNNVRYIELHPKRLKELTYPMLYTEHPITPMEQGSNIQGTGVSHTGETNTEITGTETTSTDRVGGNPEKPTINVFNEYENRWGILPAAALRSLNAYLDEGFDPALIVAMMDYAIKKGKRLNYATAILDRLSDEQGVKTLEAYEALQQQKRADNVHAFNHKGGRSNGATWEQSGIPKNDGGNTAPRDYLAEERKRRAENGGGYQFNNIESDF